MRFREILQEYDRSKTGQQMGGSIAQAAEKENQLSDLEPQEQVERVLEKAEAADPTANKKYVLWIVRQFVKNNLKFEDINEFLKKDITAFHELPKQRKQQLGIETDINLYTWRDIREIAIKLEKAMDLEEPVDAELDYENIDDMKVLYLGDMGQLIIPQTEAASCEIGSGTRWCTAATESDNEFSNYSAKGDLYVWIPSRKMPEKKQSNKFQFHFESAEFMDENNKRIDSELIRYFRTEHPVVKKLFAKREAAIAQNPSWAYKYARKVIKGRFPAGEAAIAQDPEWAFRYASDVIKQLEGENRWPAGEAAIAQDTEWAYKYARKVIKGRFPEGEEVIAQVPEQAFLYALYVIKELEGENRWPAGEELFAQDPEWAYRYALEVIGGRFPEGEAVIAGHIGYAVYYALRVIKELEGGNRFPAGEEVIAQDPEWAYRYARNVIGGRFPEGEEVLAQDSDWAYQYAHFVIKELEGGNRFPAGEELFAQDARYTYMYARNVVGGRWPEPHRDTAEATIKKDSRYWEAYVELVKQSENQ